MCFSLFFAYVTLVFENFIKSLYIYIGHAEVKDSKSKDLESEFAINTFGGKNDPSLPGSRGEGREFLSFSDEPSSSCKELKEHSVENSKEDSEESKESYPSSSAEPPSLFLSDSKWRPSVIADTAEDIEMKSNHRDRNSICKHMFFNSEADQEGGMYVYMGL
jgi:hypothetical protein